MKYIIPFSFLLFTTALSAHNCCLIWAQEGKNIVQRADCNIKDEKTCKATFSSRTDGQGMTRKMPPAQWVSTDEWISEDENEVVKTPCDPCFVEEKSTH